MPKTTVDPRVELRKRIGRDVVKGPMTKFMRCVQCNARDYMVHVTGCPEFPESETYAGDAARFWFRNLRAAVDALITVAEGEL